MGLWALLDGFPSQPEPSGTELFHPLSSHPMTGAHAWLKCLMLLLSGLQVLVRGTDQASALAKALHKQRM